LDGIGERVGIDGCVDFEWLAARVASGPRHVVGGVDEVPVSRSLDGRASRLGGNIGASLIKPTELADKMLDEITRLPEAEPSRSLSAVQLARTRGDATPQEEEDARRQAMREARAGR
jgi:hypothetical protein